MDTTTLVSIKGITPIDIHNLQSFGRCMLQPFGEIHNQLLLNKKSNKYLASKTLFLIIASMENESFSLLTCLCAAKLATISKAP